MSIKLGSKYESSHVTGYLLHGIEIESEKCSILNIFLVKLLLALTRTTGWFSLSYCSFTMFLYFVCYFCPYLFILPSRDWQVAFISIQLILCNNLNQSITISTFSLVFLQLFQVLDHKRKVSYCWQDYKYQCPVRKEKVLINFRK